MYRYKSMFKTFQLYIERDAEPEILFIDIEYSTQRFETFEALVSNVVEDHFIIVSFSFKVLFSEKILETLNSPRRYCLMHRQVEIRETDFKFL